MIIALDAMRGDHAPEQIVLGAVQAVTKYDCSIVLVGDKTQIMEVLSSASGVNKNKITVQYTRNFEAILSYRFSYFVNSLFIITGIIFIRLYFIY